MSICETLWSLLIETAKKPGKVFLICAIVTLMIIFGLDTGQLSSLAKVINNFNQVESPSNATI